MDYHHHDDDGDDYFLPSGRRRKQKRGFLSSAAVGRREDGGLWYWYMMCMGPFRARLTIERGIGLCRSVWSLCSTGLHYCMCTVDGEFQTFKLLIQRCWDRRNAHVRFGLSLTKCLIPDRYSFCLVNPYSECKPDPDT